MRPLARALAALALLPLAAAAPARAQPLVADLSSHLVAITTGFSGTDVLLFGSLDGEGDVVVVVRGPEERVLVRRKERSMGIFVNRKSLTFDRVPSFYLVAASGDLDRIAPPAERTREEIGTDYLRLQPVRASDPDTVAAYRAALVRDKQAEGLFARAPGRVAFLGARLFRVDVHFPSNVPVGTYRVQVFLFRNGAVAGAETTPLVVGKAGLGAEIYEFAQHESVAYGVLAVAVALAIGWLVGLLFRRM